MVPCRRWCRVNWQLFSISLVRSRKTAFLVIWMANLLQHRLMVDNFRKPTVPNKFSTSISQRVTLRFNARPWVDTKALCDIFSSDALLQIRHHIFSARKDVNGCSWAKQSMTSIWCSRDRNYSLRRGRNYIYHSDRPSYGRFHTHRLNFVFCQNRQKRRLTEAWFSIWTKTT